MRQQSTTHRRRRPACRRAPRPLRRPDAGTGCGGPCWPWSPWRWRTSRSRRSRSGRRRSGTGPGRPTPRSSWARRSTTDGPATCTRVGSTTPPSSMTTVWWERSSSPEPGQRVTGSPRRTADSPTFGAWGFPRPTFSSSTTARPRGSHCRLRIGCWPTASSTRCCWSRTRTTRCGSRRSPRRSVCRPGCRRPTGQAGVSQFVRESGLVSVGRVIGYRRLTNLVG